MDKLIRALSLAEDGSINTDKLRRSLAERTAAKVSNGVSQNGVTTFGTITTVGGQGVIVTFSGDGASLIFCGEEVASGGSPILAVLPQGVGELKLSEVRSGARALVFGGR